MLWAPDKARKRLPRARPISVPSARLPSRIAWTDLFPGTVPPNRTNLVLIWSDWSPHAPNALIDLQRLHTEARARDLDLGVMTVVPEGSRRSDIDRILKALAIHLPEISLRADRLHLTGALNQIPTELLFRDGVLLEQRLGPLSYDELAAWLERADVTAGSQQTLSSRTGPLPSSTARRR